MKNLFCLTLGHKIHIRDGYPSDPTTTTYCYRCGKIIRQYNNPSYSRSYVHPDPPWEIRSNGSEHRMIKINRIYSDMDPYGEEIWD